MPLSNEKKKKNLISEWQIVAHACAAYSLVIISLYETLGPTVVEYCINHSDTRVVVASAAHIPDLLRNAHATPTMKIIISADRWQDLQPVQPKTVSAADQRTVLKSWGEQLGIGVYDMEESM
jgi:long-chain acyl-CoA synthetase